MNNPNFNDILAEALAKEKARNTNKIKFKIFDGTAGFKADEENPKIKILGWQYSQSSSSMGYHGICIMYCEE